MMNLNSKIQNIQLQRLKIAIMLKNMYLGLLDGYKATNKEPPGYCEGDTMTISL